MSAHEWIVTKWTAAHGGDLFAVIVEKRVPTRVRRSNGEYDTNTSCEATVAVWGSLSRRGFVGASILEGYEHEIAVVDAAGGPPVIILAHSRDEAPLVALDVSKGERVWSSPDLRGAWMLSASKRSRTFGACYRGNTKLVSADTGKYRWTWRGDVQPLDTFGRWCAGLLGASKAQRLELRDTSTGELTFERELSHVRDAVLTDDQVIVAGEGIHALGRGGRPLWSVATNTQFDRVSIRAEGFRAWSSDDGKIIDVQDGQLVRELDVQPADDACLLGADHFLSEEGVRSIAGGDDWLFADDLHAYADAALAQRAERTSAGAAGPAASPHRVVHKRFGEGTVLGEVDGKTRVKFDDGTERTLATEFLAPLTN